MTHLSFDWVAIGAVATFIMAIVTFWSLFQNRQQLSELKRQWDEQNKPRILPQLIRTSGYVCLRIKNYSNSSAYNININIESNAEISSIHNIEDYIEKISSVKYNIEPNGFKDFKLFIDYNPDITSYNGYLDIKLEYNEQYKEEHTLPLAELNAIIYTKPMQSILEDINKKLGRL